ncbi:hypothetical protein Tco_1111992 [Tanacetum coccineum]|uniref:Uncharacterized protein n=1 Tax=Tanacetum coccineum TaxID=301880 RepID=A0ABQ5INI3_9ASTR
MKNVVPTPPTDPPNTRDGSRKKEISLDNDRLLEHIISQDIMNIMMNSDSLPINVLPANNNYIVHICVNSLATLTNYAKMEQDYIDEYNKNLMLKAELLQHQKESFLNNRSFNNQNAPAILEFLKINEWQAKLNTKDVSFANLRKQIESLKGENVVEKDVQLNNPNFIAPGMFKIDLEPLAPKVLKNKDAHIDYIKHTQEHADTLREIVKNDRALRPSDSNLNYACHYVQRIQEVLVYVKDTCPYLTKPSEKLVGITPLNRTRRVRVSSSTKASKSKPRSNTKKDRIPQTSSSNKKKNKVEYHPRIAKSSLNNKNRVIEHVCNANVKHTTLNVNSELICVKCNQYMFNANHDVCFLEFVNDVNVSSKSKSPKNSKKNNIWKPTGKVFIDIGYRWKPTGQTFTIVGNMCPLTRITSIKVVPLKETTSKSVTIQNPEVKVYSRRPKVIKSVGSSSKSKIVESMISNNSKPNQSWGSNASDIPSSSLVNFRLSKFFSI